VNDFPWLLVPSGAAAALTILAFGLLGDSARDAAAEGWSRPASAPKRAQVAAIAIKPVSAFDPQAVLSLRGLTITANGVARPIVNGFDLDLKPGETLGVVGESGSGKTMTILSLIGLLPHGLHVENGAMPLTAKRSTSETKSGFVDCAATRSA
jgi:peptide/nickel transport system permease protein